MSTIGVANYQVNPAISASVHAAGRSFLAGFVVNILVAGMNNGTSVVAGVTGGVLSAAATLIDFAIRPLITALFGSNRDNAFFIGLSCNVIFTTSSPQQQPFRTHAGHDRRGQYNRIGVRAHCPVANWRLDYKLL